MARLSFGSFHGAAGGALFTMLVGNKRQSLIEAISDLREVMRDVQAARRTVEHSEGILVHLASRAHPALAELQAARRHLIEAEAALNRALLVLF